jgi:predicted MFS family arabinose efflux permease
MLAGIVGALAGGFLADRYGRRLTLAVASAAMAAGWVAFGLLSTWWSSTPFLYTAALYEQVCTSMMLVSIFALCMDVAWAVTAATQFTAYIAMSNFSGALGYRFAGVANDWFGFERTYLFAAGIQIVVTMLLAFIDPGQTARELPLPAGAPTPRRGIAAVAIFALALVVLTGYVVSGLL